MTREFDHIVVGGGSAGCVAASRLVTEGNRRVLLLEGGHSNRHPLLDMPPGIFKLIADSKYMTYHQTVPQPQLDGRSHDIPQGNVLGGGSSVNAQVYMRGRPADYDEWHDSLGRDAGAAAWDWPTMLGYFRAMEGNDRLNDELHGTDGPLLVSDPGHVDDISRWFVQSVQALGEPYTHDFNGPSQRGVGFYQFMNRKGQRCSAAHGFIDPLGGDSRLDVRLRAQVESIVIEKGRAVGVRYRDANGASVTARATGDILLAAGALMTPKIMMLSGVGPAAHLSENGIAPVLDLPGVGANLKDHPEIPLIALANGPYGYYGQGVGARMLWNGVHFKMFGAGRITTVGFEAGAFANPNVPGGPPLVQAFCIPIVYLDRDLRKVLSDTYGVTITTVLCKPRSRGWVRLRSADPADLPLVSPNLLADPQDLADAIAGQRFFLRALKEGPLGKRVDRIVAPDGDSTDDAVMARHCKRFVKTNYHPVSTARMGPDGDSMAVLDSRMRVRGIDGLRVCDLSAAPDIIAGNTNALAMAFGARCADFVLGRAEAGAIQFQQQGSLRASQGFRS
jgi:choline dehydrogenase